jgi:hypothetical protein
MEDERRKFLQGLLALGGGAAILPELVEAAQQTLKVEQPFYSTEVNRQTETRIDERTVDRQSQIVIIGANDVKHVETMLMTSIEGSGYRRQHITTHVALYQHSGDAEPVHTYITAGTTTVRPIEGTKLVEVTVQGTSPKGVKEKKFTVEASARLAGGDVTTKEQMLEKFLEKVRGGKS